MTDERRVVFSWAQDNDGGAPKVERREATGARAPKPKVPFNVLRPGKIINRTYKRRWGF